MLQIGSAAISILLGIFSGLGIGGGSLLVLWLISVCSMDPQNVKAITLLFFIAPAVFSCIANRRTIARKQKYILAAALAGSAASIFFATISHSWNVQLVRKLFGILLFCSSIRELRYKQT